MRNTTTVLAAHSQFSFGITHWYYKIEAFDPTTKNSGIDERFFSWREISFNDIIGIADYRYDFAPQPPLADP